VSAAFAPLPAAADKEHLLRKQHIARSIACFFHQLGPIRIHKRQFQRLTLAAKIEKTV